MGIVQYKNQESYIPYVRVVENFLFLHFLSQYSIYAFVTWNGVSLKNREIKTGMSR